MTEYWRVQHTAPCTGLQGCNHWVWVSEFSFPQQMMKLIICCRTKIHCAQFKLFSQGLTWAPAVLWIFQIILQTGIYPTFTGYNQKNWNKKKKYVCGSSFRLLLESIFFNKLQNYPEMKKCRQYTHEHNRS